MERGRLRHRGAHVPLAIALNRNVLVLAALQALLLANNATAITLHALAGRALAPDKSWATLPITGWVVGAALSTYWASSLMRRVGRKRGFAVGATFGILGTTVCALALYLGSFVFFLVGTSLLGVYNAFGAYHRFAAADAVDEPARARAISYVLAGGLVGGIVGPATSRLTIHALSTPFLGGYLALLGLFGVVLAVQRLLDLPEVVEAASGEPARSLGVIAVQPAFVVAALSGAFGYGVMNLLMTATPLAMGACGHSYDAATTVIASHDVGMYAPSFFTGDLIKRFGPLRVMLVGVLLNLACVMIALRGVEISDFWWALVLLGVGWNFLYVGATTLLTDVHRPSEKAKTQGLNDAIIFGTMVVSSFSSGVILEQGGWQTLNRAALPFIVVVGIALMVLARRLRPRAAKPAS
jgi:MFS family permease